MLSSKIVCELLPLHLSGSGRASQETSISDSFQQAFLDTSNNAWLWCLYMQWIPRWGSLWMAFPSVSAPHFVSIFTPLLGTLGSVQWLAASICLCICKALAEPLRRQSYQDPLSMYFLASTIVTVYGMNPQVGQSLDGLSFSFCSTLYLHIYSCKYFVTLL